METTLKKINSVRYQLKIEADTQSLTQKINQKLYQTQKQAKIDGFRKGKVPLAIIKNKYEPSIKSQCIDDLIFQSYEEAIKKEKLMPISAPKFDILSKLEDEKALENGLIFTVEFDIFPTVNLKPLEQLEMETITCNPTEKDFDDQIKQIQEKNPIWKENTGKAKEGDALDILYQLTIKEEAKFEKPNELKVVIGSKTMIPGFEEKMIGLAKGDKTEFNLTFPKDYSHQELQNENVKFNIEVVKVESPEISELNDEFAKKMGAKGGLDEFKALLRKNINQEAKRQVLGLNRNTVVDTILKANDFEIPESMIHKEQHMIFDSQKRELEQKKMDSSHLKISDFKEDAFKRVKVSLLFHTIIEQFKLKDDEKRFEKKLEEIADQYGGANQMNEIKKFYEENEEQKKSLQSMCMEEQVINFILSKAKTTAKELNFEKLIQQSASL